MLAVQIKLHITLRYIYLCVSIANVAEFRAKFAECPQEAYFCPLKSFYLSFGWAYRNLCTFHLLKFRHQEQEISRVNSVLPQLTQFLRKCFGI